MRLDAIGIHYLANKLSKAKMPLLPKILDGIIFLLFNSYIHHSTLIGEKTICAYWGMSVLIHKKSIIGSNVNIGAHVVIGGRSGYENVPIVEDGVFIGSNSTILGPIRIGKGSIIGAGSVVLHDVPEYSIVVGVPARIIKRVEK